MDNKKAQKIVKKFSKRMIKEIKTNTENKGFDFAVLDDMHWYFRFTVQSGLYAGQKHIVEIKLFYGQSPDLYVYPMHAPKCTFITPVWHPNISEKGTICLDVLKDNWSPSMFTSTIISALGVLLEEPDPTSPQNAKAAKMLTLCPEGYNNYVKKYSEYSAAPLNIRSLFS